MAARMSIKGLVPSLPERGHIKIGVKGAEVTSSAGKSFQPPKKLDHFVITTMNRGPDGNFLRDEAIHALLGDKPTSIPVRLLYDDPELNFLTRYACYVGRNLFCSGDGESATRNLPNETRTVTCTCERIAPTYTQRDKCKMNGSLSLLIDGAGGIGGVWKFRTTSYNSVVGIMSSLSFLRSITGGPLANLPLSLKIAPKQTVNPTDPTQSVTIYVVSIGFDGTIEELQKIGHQIALGRATTHISIEHIEHEARRLLSVAPPGVPLPGDDEADIVAEFYPEQEPPPRPRLEDFEPLTASEEAAADLAAERFAQTGEEPTCFDGETGEIIEPNDESLPIALEPVGEYPVKGASADRTAWADRLIAHINACNDVALLGELAHEHQRGALKSPDRPRIQEAARIRRIALLGDC